MAPQKAASPVSKVTLSSVKLIARPSALLLRSSGPGLEKRVAPQKAASPVSKVTLSSVKLIARPSALLLRSSGPALRLSNIVPPLRPSGVERRQALRGDLAMNPLKARTYALAGATLSLFLALPLLGQAAPEVEIGVVEAAEGVYMLTGEGGNLGISVGEDGVFLIDDQFAPLTAKILAAIATVSDQPIRFLVNTHWHFDHTGGNENLGKAGVVIVAHDNVRQRMSAGGLIEFFENQIPPAPQAALPVITFADSVTFHWNGDELHVFHVPPAHTDGDSVIHFRRANVVHTGDLYFNGLYPFIDNSSGASVDGVIAAAERIHGMIDDQTRIIPGHGPLSNRAELATYIEMLKGVRANIGALVEAGKSLKEVLAAKPTAAWDEKWGMTFLKGEQFTSIVYENLAAK